MRDVFGDNAVNQGIDFLIKRLGKEQGVVVEMLRSIKGGILLIQGPGGVGKTAILVQLSVLYY